MDRWKHWVDNARVPFLCSVESIGVAGAKHDDQPSENDSTWRNEGSPTVARVLHHLEKRLGVAKRASRTAWPSVTLALATANLLLQGHSADEADGFGSVLRRTEGVIDLRCRRDFDAGHFAHTTSIAWEEEPIVVSTAASMSALGGDGSGSGGGCGDGDGGSGGGGASFSTDANTSQLAGKAGRDGGAVPFQQRALSLIHI